MTSLFYLKHDCFNFFSHICFVSCEDFFYFECVAYVQDVFHLKTSNFVL